MRIPTPRSAALPLLIAACLAACASGPEPPPSMDFEIETAPQANDGRLFYVMARSVNEKQFMMENYQDVATKAFADPPDPSVLVVFSVIPGAKQEFTITQPMKGTVALYFLLTRPGQQWKRLLSPPLDDDYEISIAADNEVKIEQD